VFCCLELINAAHMMDTNADLFSRLRIWTIRCGQCMKKFQLPVYNPLGLRNIPNCTYILIIEIRYMFVSFPKSVSASESISSSNGHGGPRYKG